MNFELSEDQSILCDSVRRLLDDTFSFQQRRALLSGGDQVGDKSPWRSFADLGLLGVLITEEAGGIGGNVVDAMLVCIEMGRSLVTEPYVETALAAAAMLQAASMVSKDLESLVAGETAFALSYRDLGGAEPTIIARPDREGTLTISGAAERMIGGSIATNALVTASLSGKTCILNVDLSADGVVRHDYRAVDSRGLTDIRFDNLELSRNAIVAAGAEADDILSIGFDHAIIGNCAQLLGAMEAAFELTVEYLKTRRQFGSPLAQFQALRHRVADMFVHLELARSMLYRAVGTLGQGDREAAMRITSAAKILICDCGKYVCAEAIQLHGGIGIAEEHAVGHFYKRAVVCDLLLGRPSTHAKRFREVA